MSYYPFPPKAYAISRYREVLANPSTPPNAAYFTHDFNNYSLEARILYNAQRNRPWVFSIHGARADNTKADIINFSLQKRGYSILGMSMSGHSKAGVIPLAQTSLANNIAEAEAFFGYLDPDRPKALISYSLGGTPALKVLGEHLDEVNKLILCYPGIYSIAAYTKKYGKAFKEILHMPYSYRDNDTIATLKRFKGEVLLVKGEYDGLDPEQYGKKAGEAADEVVIDGVKYYSPIPKDVFTLITAAVPEGRLQFLEVPKCGHSLPPWLESHPEEAPAIFDKFDAFLRK